MSECESVRGDWGGICPDCGERLPRPVKGPPSEKLRHVVPWQIDGRRGWSEKRIAAYVANGR